MMLIMFSPFRISLLGGGTDIPEFYNRYGGNVLGFASSLGCYVTINNTEIHNRRTAFRLVYSQTEETESTEEIQHPLIREFIRFHGYEELELHFNADLPSVSGLGTSSAFANAMSAGFSHLIGKHLSPREIANFSIHMERSILKEAGGVQDQIISAFGGCCRINMSNDGWTVEKLNLNSDFKNNLLDSIVLVKVGWGSKEFRNSSEIETRKVQSENNINRLKDTLDLANIGIQLFLNEDISELGKTIDHIWHLKRQFEGVSNLEVDECCDFLKTKGAIGCRLLGAGGRGFLLAIGEPGFATKIVELLGKSRALKIKISEYGTKKMEIREQ